MQGRYLTIIEVHGYGKQGSGYGYSGVRGLNALIAIDTAIGSAPVGRGPTPTQRLMWGIARRQEADRDALKVTSTLTDAPMLVRADSTFYGSATVGAALRAGADV